MANRSFMVAELLRRSFAYNVHEFHDREHFVEWRKQNPGLNIVDISCARGRCKERIDHRYDWILEELPTGKTTPNHFRR